MRNGSMRAEKDDSEIEKRRLERIDEIDAQILTLLQEKGRIKRGMIAEEVGLSLPSVSDRIRKLEERNVITGYHAVVDPRKLGYDIGAFIRVVVDGSAHYEDFVKNALEQPEVQEVHSGHGRWLAYSAGGHARYKRT